MEEHDCCPECGSLTVIRTLQDNTVKCTCGWKGILEDLIPDRMSAQRLREIYKAEVQIDLNNPQSWDNEMIADYFVWMLGKKSTKDAESIIEMTIEKWRA